MKPIKELRNGKIAKVRMQKQTRILRTECACWVDRSQTSLEILPHARLSHMPCSAQNTNPYLYKEGQGTLGKLTVEPARISTYHR
jgi:hypothetical protein